MKQLTPDDRPREKLLKNGPAVLGDNELVALVLGHGLRGMDALHVANELLHVRGGVHGLVRSTAADLSRVANHELQSSKPVTSTRVSSLIVVRVPQANVKVRKNV